MADVDLEAAREPRRIDLVRTEQQHDFGLCRFDVGDAARLRIAEDQARHARCARVEHVEAVPARRGSS